ncbi:hypothetical protein HELRODRAFT_175574 [Helobdella robusta]|uniref:Uncharacterized protein n=1 Tax=Helobdella robusta TaxID=6412 RepID=T1F9E2_HELRO|nr:hypothetical protein HELRODRAFT_175574 [Helobdella robusta]ESO00605.1 hypothetical protein HELRODRAFT_175574 [Helobdella robusta]
MKSDENIVNTETGKKKKGVKKIIGNKDSEDCKLKANKILIKKSFFSVSNVMKCHRDDVVEYLKSNDINVLSCYPVLKRSEMANDSTPDIENEHSTMFRVCVESCDSNKMKNPDIILKHIIVPCSPDLNEGTGGRKHRACGISAEPGNLKTQFKRSTIKIFEKNQGQRVYQRAKFF